MAFQQIKKTKNKIKNTPTQKKTPQQQNQTKTKQQTNKKNPHR